VSIYLEGVLIGIGINVLLALGFWITANTGQFSFGHAGFMAIGAYASALLTLRAGWPLFAAMLAGGLAAAVAGALVGWPALRLSVLYLAMITLAFAELVKIVFTNWSAVGGASGLAGMSGTTLPLVGGLIAVLLAYLWLVSRSRVGLAYAALREDETAARAAGLNVTAIEVGAFAQSAFVTGAAGALSGHYLLFVNPEMFGAHQSLLIILYTVFGGLQTFWGPLLGAAVLSALPEVVDFLEDWYLIAYGALFVVLMIVRPQGLLAPRPPQSAPPATSVEATPAPVAGAPAGSRDAQG
jgi:branched-chain amino acid transport system permease protein